MIDQPFSILRPFADRIGVQMFTKKDGVPTLESIRASLGADTIAKPALVHGNRTIIVRSSAIHEHDADAIATDRSGLALAITWADCQNFVAYAPKRHVIGLIHAGWRGLVAGIIPSFFETVKKEWGIGAEEFFVGAGPSLCKKCADFSAPEHEVPSLKEFTDGRHVDLQAAAQAQCTACGVPDVQFERHPGCTRCDPQTFWTYRGGDREDVKRKAVNFTACVLR